VQPMSERIELFKSTHEVKPLREARSLLGSHDVLIVTLDALRYDVATEALAAGLTPNFEAILPEGKWELRHTPGNFTYSAHQAFFAGFLPTPATPGIHSRLFAVNFAGSSTIDDSTIVFDSPDIISGFAAAGYHTVCVGGVGFFNKQNRLGEVLPSYFAESHWQQSFGVTSRTSAEEQFCRAITIANKLPPERRLLTFINVSALHQPNCIFSQGVSEDSKETQQQALVYVDQHIGPLLASLCDRKPLIVLVFSDHGTAYGEGGYVGHRISHEVVWNVPYAEFILEKTVNALSPRE
jgi:hypothetical protein